MTFLVFRLAEVKGLFVHPQKIQILYNPKDGRSHLEASNLRLEHQKQPNIISSLN